MSKPVLDTVTFFFFIFYLKEVVSLSSCYLFVKDATNYTDKQSLLRSSLSRANNHLYTFLLVGSRLFAASFSLRRRNGLMVSALD